MVRRLAVYGLGLALVASATASLAESKEDAKPSQRPALTAEQQAALEQMKELHKRLRIARLELALAEAKEAPEREIATRAADVYRLEGEMHALRVKHPGIGRLAREERGEWRGLGGRGQGPGRRAGAGMGRGGRHGMGGRGADIDRGGRRGAGAAGQWGGDGPGRGMGWRRGAGPDCPFLGQGPGYGEGRRMGLGSGRGGMRGMGRGGMRGMGRGMGWRWQQGVEVVPPAAAAAEPQPAAKVAH